MNLAEQELEFPAAVDLLELGADLVVVDALFAPAVTTARSPIAGAGNQPKVIAGRDAGAFVSWGGAAQLQLCGGNTADVEHVVIRCQLRCASGYPLSWV